MRKFGATELGVLLFIYCFCVNMPMAIGQERILGRVVDELTGKGIPQASIKVVGTSIGTSCDSLGNFVVAVNSDKTHHVEVSAMGYRTYKGGYMPSATGVLIKLHPDERVIDAIEISSKRKYNNKNPAVELIEEVIKHKRVNRMERQPKHSFEQYDKIRFGMVDPSSKYLKGLGSMRFFFENIDTVSIPGSKLLALFMKEQISDVYHTNDPVSSKKIVKSVKQTKYDERHINNHNIQSYLTYLFQDVDIYAENIFLINKLFLSPIANNAPVFYKYYIVDTVQVDTKPFVELRFEPRNKTDLLLSGRLWVSLDGRYAVGKARLNTNKEANLNWVNRIDIEQDFTINEAQQMLLERSDVQILFGTEKKEALFGQKITMNYDFDFKPTFSDAVFSGAPIEVLAGAENSGAILEDKRPIPLNRSESRVYQNVDSLNDNRTFKTLVTLGYLIGQGFYNLGPFEIGPVEYLYSTNNIEGNRIRLGGRTTGLFSEKFYMEGYLAYGLRDQSFKYFVKPTIALNGKSVTTFPAHYLQFGVQHDIFDPGRNLGFKKGDSFFQSIRSNKPTKWLDTYAYEAKHLIEFGNHLSIQSGFVHHRRHAIGDLNFISSGDPHVKVEDINTNELEFVLRWAPNEKFYYRNLVRRTIIEKHPIFNVQYNKGLRGFWGADYNYDALRAAVTKRFFMRQLGFVDVTLSGGKIWGSLPYPLLEIPDVFKNDDRHVIDYSLMRNMEFVADEFVKLSIDHQLEGFILNKIPLVKRLKLRELWGVKMFRGRLTDANNPYLSSGVVHFDTDKEGNKLTHVMGNQPYWEGKVGLDNIFRVFRVEYIRRLNYLDLPNVNKDTYRVSVHLNF